METQIPIYRAKKLNGDEYVEGMLTYGSAKTLFISNGGISGWIKIDPSTLEMSIDGKTWRSIEEVKDIITEKSEFNEELKERSEKLKEMSQTIAEWLEDED